jgi:GntR family transcriptional regulator/MocR family aminotransferase
MSILLDNHDNGIVARSHYVLSWGAIYGPDAMTKTARQVSLAGIELNRRSAVPLSNQLYEALRQSILRGQLRPGARLPSTRLLAPELGISRNTAMSAYAQLLGEGYVEARVGSGTCVARALPGEVLSVT